MSDSQPFKVLIVGGGPAALEAAFTLQRIAGAAVATTVLAPDEYFVTRPMTVLAPFAAGGRDRHPLAALVAEAGAELRRGRLASVDAEAHEVQVDDGEAIPYDALLIATGARPTMPFPKALAFGGPGTEELMHGLVQDLEAGHVRRVAFVVPAGSSWPLPLYELALMTADRAFDMGMKPELAIVTPEAEPLALFGPQASRALADQLAAADITVHSGTHVSVPKHGVVDMRPSGEQLQVDRIVSLPVLEGPELLGLPHDQRGFLAVDRHGRVEGVSDVYAAGDATNFPIKQGGLACQQADAAAEAIAAAAGVAIEPEPFKPVLQGVLLTEHTATYMRRDASGTAGDQTAVAGRALWWPPTKIAGRELARHIELVPRSAVTAEDGVEVEVPVGTP